MFFLAPLIIPKNPGKIPSGAYYSGDGVEDAGGAVPVGPGPAVEGGALD